MKRIFLMLVLTVLATTAWAQSQITTVRGKTKEGKTIKVEYYKGNVEDYVESVKYQLVDELQAKVKELQDKLDEANKQIEQMKKPLSGGNNAEIKRLNNEIGDLNKALDDLQSQLVSCELGKDSIASANADLTYSLADCEKQVKKLEDDLAYYGSRPVGHPKPSPVIGAQFGFGPAFTSGVEEGWSRDVNWMKKAEVYFGTARLTPALPVSVEAGVGIRSLKFSASKAPGELVESGIDANGDSFQAMYSFGALQESHSLTYLDIPIRVCLGQPAKGMVGVYAKVGVTPSVKVADNFKGTGTYTFKGYYPQWDVTLENITELGFGTDMDYYTAENQPEANGFVLWGNAMLGAYVPFKGTPVLLNAGLGIDVPFMNLTQTHAGSKAVIPSLEIGMVYSLK